MKYLLTLVCLLSICALLTGCPSGRTKMPAVVKEKVRTYAITKFDTDYAAYNTAVNDEKFELAKLRRNEMIFQLKRNIDANYLEFENGLFIGKATSNILFDITELGAALAGTISNGERAKTIISSSLSMFKGSRKSAEINLFREKTTESLIQTMRASRSKRETKINIGLRNTVADYTLEESLGDLIDYFYAGSLSNALVELSQQAADKANDAKNEADDATKKRLEQGFNESKDIDGIRNQLYVAIKTGTDGEKAAAREKLLKALGTLKTDLPDLKVNFSTNDSNDALFTELQRVIKVAVTDLDEIPTDKILKALKGQ